MLSDKTNILATPGKLISASTIKKNATIPFKDHEQFNLILDTFCRKNCHHALLYLPMPRQLYIAFTEAFVLFLSAANIPFYLQNADCIYLDIGDREYYFDDALQSLKGLLDASEKYLIIALPNHELLLRKQMTSLIAHPKCRLLLLADEQVNIGQFAQDFNVLSIHALSESNIHTILKHQCNELESFHHVLIPDELLSAAYLLAKRFLSTDSSLEKTLLLLDSCAGRAGIITSVNQPTSLKPMLTHVTLLQVLSEWTRIPVSHLQLHKFNYHEFIQATQQKIFSQENALTLLGQALQQSHAHLREYFGPFCSLLFTGPKEVGKKATALALTEYLFKQSSMLFYANPWQSSIHSIWEMKFCSHTSKQLFTLQAIMKETPYAVIYFATIEKSPLSIMEQLVEILNTGYARDAQGNLHCFQHASLIFATTIGASCLAECVSKLEQNNDPHTLDLMQLVSGNSSSSITDLSPYSPQEIIDAVLPELKTQLPALHQLVHIIPFLPLNKSAVENIIRVRLKLLGKQLNALYGIELGYAPEVIRYLASEVMKQALIDIEQPLKQLYIHVEQTVVSQIDNKNNSNQLFLQLNETGQVLRCEWLHLTTTR
ncbi:MAG: hypothetical protein A3F11_08850 [Gammaproteobacteria bacterium RIFCSPHIGHO2_12_FULL_37_14]|nr:MAG: hypothetical protein A3F11_08850 [Gammaproteobacteria bacterium RIFCSPHIGHO2_12_FULL_37_14]